jgi:hypothetical protein
MTKQTTHSDTTDPKVSDNYHIMEAATANEVYKKMLDEANLYHRQKRVDAVSVVKSPELEEQVKEFITELDINANNNDDIANNVNTTNLQDVITVNP